MQDEEYGELKKKRREERAVIRKKEQRLYEEESVSLSFRGIDNDLLGFCLLCRAGAWC